MICKVEFIGHLDIIFGILISCLFICAVVIKRCIQIINKLLYISNLLIICMHIFFLPFYILYGLLVNFTSQICAKYLHGVCIYFSQSSYEIGTVVTPVLQIRK